MRSQYTHAYPVLRSFEFPATFFIIACTLEDRLTPGGKLALLATHKSTKWIVNQVKEILQGTFYDFLLSESFPMGNFYQKEKDPSMRKIKILLNRVLPAALRNEIMNDLLTTAGLLKTERTTCRKDFLNHATLLEMAQNDMEVGSHSMTHPFMGELAQEEAWRELSESAKVISFYTGTKIDSFAWPIGGTFPVRITNLITQHHQSGWSYFMEPVNMNPPYDFSCVPRIDEQYFEEALGIEKL